MSFTPEPLAIDRYEDPNYDTTYEDRVSDWNTQKKEVRRHLECLLQQTIETALIWLPTPTRNTTWLAGAIREALLSKSGYADLCTAVFDSAEVDGRDWDKFYENEIPEPKMREDEKEN